MPVYVFKGVHKTGEYRYFEFIETAPAGWAVADGSEVARDGIFARLFNLIGTTYGAGDGISTFNLPDRRGEFIRAFDAGRGKDAGRVQGSSQASQNKAHNHTGTATSAGAHEHGLDKPNTGGGGGEIFGVNGFVENSPLTENTSTAGAHTHSLSINNDGGTESRPENFAALLCIKL